MWTWKVWNKQDAAIIIRLFKPAVHIPHMLVNTNHHLKMNLTIPIIIPLIDFIFSATGSLATSLLNFFCNRSSRYFSCDVSSRPLAVLFLHMFCSVFNVCGICICLHIFIVVCSVHKVYWFVCRGRFNLHDNRWVINTTVASRVVCPHHSIGFQQTSS